MEHEYKILMEQSFILRHYGHLTLEEQNCLSGEDRAWWINRLIEENDKQKNSGKPKGGPGNPPS